MEFTGGPTEYTSGTVHELTADSTPVEREFYDFYRTSRGAYIPAGASEETTTHPTLTSNLKFMNFYPFKDIETISPRPMLFITGDSRTPANSVKMPTSERPSRKSCTSFPVPATSISTTGSTSFRSTS